MTNYKHKDEILRLRAEGKTYNQIREITGASKATISYHCGEGQVAKARAREKRVAHLQIKKNLSRWRSRPETGNLEKKIPTKKWSDRIRTRVRGFHSDEELSNGTFNFTYEDVLERIDQSEVCYLTGRPIDKWDSSTFHFDHVQPRSKGGQNTLENLELACRDANFSKHDLTLEEYLMLCVEVLLHWGIIDESDIQLTKD